MSRNDEIRERWREDESISGDVTYLLDENDKLRAEVERLERYGDWCLVCGRPDAHPKCTCIHDQPGTHAEHVMTEVERLTEALREVRDIFDRDSTKVPDESRLSRGEILQRIYDAAKDDFPPHDECAALNPESSP